MGDYTRLTIDVCIKPSLEPVVYDVLRYITTNDEHIQKLIEVGWNGTKPNVNHPFFDCDSWAYVFSDGCAYLPRIHQPEFIKESYHHRLKGSGSSKNMDDRYEKFLDWLRPYMFVDKPNEVVAYTEFDVDQYPKVLYMLDRDEQLVTKTEKDPRYKDNDYWMY